METSGVPDTVHYGPLYPPEDCWVADVRLAGMHAVNNVDNARPGRTVALSLLRVQRLDFLNGLFA